MNTGRTTDRTQASDAGSQLRSFMPQMESMERVEHLSETTLGLSVTCCMALMIVFIVIPTFDLMGVAWIKTWEGNAEELDFNSTFNEPGALNTTEPPEVSWAENTTTTTSSSALAASTTPPPLGELTTLPPATGTVPVTAAPPAQGEPIMGVPAIVTGVVTFIMTRSSESTDAEELASNSFKPIVEDSLTEFFGLEAGDITNIEETSATNGEDDKIHVVWTFELELDDGGSFEELFVGHATEFEDLIEQKTADLDENVQPEDVDVDARITVNYYATDPEGQEKLAGQNPTHKVSDEGETSAA